MPEPSAIDPSDTIAAIATPPGEGGIGIVRLSGPASLPIARHLFRSSSGRDLDRGRVFHGHIADAGGTALDEVLVHVMRAPSSYTREDVVEINAHGGPGPLQAILEETLRAGARLAKPGEFTQRAFLNGRIDLVQAEAVIDQIRARTRAGLQAANAAAGGILSRELRAMRDRLRDALAYIEAAVDFPEDDLGELVSPELLAGLAQVRRDMRALLDTADAGRLYREGATVAIAGRPNVGKSSLFNALLRDARAIVTPVAGTTRDRLEDYVNLEGIPVRLIDTAGLRDTEDHVERIGVDRARDALGEAALVLLVVDVTALGNPEDAAIAAEIAATETPLAVVVNKCDLVPDAVPPAFDATPAATCHVSALTSKGLAELERCIAQLLRGGLQVQASEALITRVHQQDSLRRAEACIARLLADPGVSPEFLALEVQQALDAIGEITGETTPDDILEQIFAGFCIGK